MQYAVFEHKSSVLLQITYYACAKQVEPLYLAHGGSRFLRQKVLFSHFGLRHIHEDSNLH
jgi:hypothetical protein